MTKAMTIAWGKSKQSAYSIPWVLRLDYRQQIALSMKIIFRQHSNSLPAMRARCSFAYIIFSLSHTHTQNIHRNHYATVIRQESSQVKQRDGGYREGHGHQ